MFKRLNQSGPIFFFYGNSYDLEKVDHQGELGFFSIMHQFKQNFFLMNKNEK